MSDLPTIETQGEALIYPMPPGARIGTFDRFDFYAGRFLRSETYRRAITQKSERAAFYSFALWSHSFEETPLGTIPSDEAAQAHIIGLGADVKRWRNVARDALSGFRPVMIEGALSDRLANPVMLAVCLDAWNRKQGWEADKETKRVEGRRSRFRKRAIEAGLPDGSLRSAEIVDLHLTYLEAQHLTINPRNVREAFDAIRAGWSPDRKVVSLRERA